MVISLRPETESRLNELAGKTGRPPDALVERAVSLYLDSPASEQIRVEFNELAEQWLRDTRHLSLISQKVAHPVYFRIIGLGRPVVPLLLEELRDRPSHWFVALKATANADPVPPGVNPAAAREAWLDWGRQHGLIE